MQLRNPCQRASAARAMLCCLERNPDCARLALTFPIGNQLVLRCRFAVYELTLLTGCKIYAQSLITPGHTRH
jgi:hypothetical protein